jgi:hypothetical protein
MGTKATVLSQIMKDGLSTLAIKYQLAQMRYMYTSSNYTILAHNVFAQIMWDEYGYLK